MEVEKPFLAFAHDIDMAHRHTAYFFQAKIVGEPRAWDDAEEVKWFSLKDMKGEEISTYTLHILNYLLIGKLECIEGQIRE